jgi:hypothetical protein
MIYMPNLSGFRIHLVFICFFPLHSHPQSVNNASPPVKVTQLTEGINFDGIPDEPVWQTLEALQLVMLSPVFGKAPTEESIIKIAYDDEYFYVSGWLSYNNPSDIRAVGKKEITIQVPPIGLVFLSILSMTNKIWSHFIPIPMAFEPREPLKMIVLILKYTYTFRL